MKALRIVAFITVLAFTAFVPYRALADFHPDITDYECSSAASCLLTIELPPNVAAHIPEDGTVVSTSCVLTFVQQAGWDRNSVHYSHGGDQRTPSYEVVNHSFTMSFGHYSSRVHWEAVNAWADSGQEVHSVEWKNLVCSNI